MLQASCFAASSSSSGVLHARGAEGGRHDAQQALRVVGVHKVPGGRQEVHLRATRLSRLTEAHAWLV